MWGGWWKRQPLPGYSCNMFRHVGYLRTQDPLSRLGSLTPDQSSVNPMTHFGGKESSLPGVLGRRTLLFWYGIAPPSDVVPKGTVEGSAMRVNLAFMPSAWYALMSARVISSFRSQFCPKLKYMVLARPLPELETNGKPTEGRPVSDGYPMVVRWSSDDYPLPDCGLLTAVGLLTATNCRLE